MATQFQETIGGLEQRVADRTRDLESQTTRLRVTAEISRDVSSSRALSDLLERSAQLIRDRFGFGHTGIFLLDNNREYAVLVASPTEAGKQMLANNYQIRVGETGIIGRVSASGEPEFSRNTEVDASYRKNPLLPNTRSEMALPLRTENRSSVYSIFKVKSQMHSTTMMYPSCRSLRTSWLPPSNVHAFCRKWSVTCKSWKLLTDNTPTITGETWRRTLKGKIGYRFDNIRIETATELPDIGRE